MTGKEIQLTAADGVRLDAREHPAGTGPVAVLAHGLSVDLAENGPTNHSPTPSSPAGFRCCA